MLKEFIYHQRKGVESEHCEALINYFESNSQKHYLGRVGSEDILDEKKKKCSEMICSENHSDWIFPLLKNVLTPHIQVYKKEHPILDMCNKWRIFCNCKIQKYNPGEGYFSTHCENEGYEGNTSSRVLAWMIYLNTVTEGGGTRFDNYDRVVDAVEGRLVIWPAYWTHFHHGIVSKTQTKHIVTGWFAYNTEDYTKKENEIIEKSVEKSMKDALSGLFSGL